MTPALLSLLLTVAPAAEPKCKPGDLADCEKQCSQDPPSCVSAGWLKYEAKDFKAAAAYYSRACDAKLPRGCYALGQLRYVGADGFAKDRAASRAPFEKACEAEMGKACMYVGLIYTDGDGLKADPMKAHRFFERGCQFDSPPACAMAADALKFGNGMGKDPKKAAALYDKACRAKAGMVPAACVQLSGMYIDGNGVKQDRRLAREIAVIGCDAKDEKSCKMRDWIDNPPKPKPAEEEEEAEVTAAPRAAQPDPAKVAHDACRNRSWGDWEICGGTCVNMKVDSRNCRTCGNDCGVGRCDDGLCLMPDGTKRW